MSCNAPSSWELNGGHFGKCQSILQEIIWMVNNWENSLRPFHITKREDEIINCENALLKVKDVIWTSCLTMFSKYDSQTKRRRGSQSAIMYVQPEMTGSKIVNCNTEVMINESNKTPVAVYQREASHMLVVSDSPNQRILKNVLFNWSVFVNPQFQLCLVGSLPNGGKWETSPIAVRLGPTRVKTISGTIYNMNGKMVVQEGIDVPDFVQEKFQDGFPLHWKSVASKWISKLKEQKFGLPGPGVSSEEAMSVPYVILNDVGKKQAVIPRQVSQQNGEFGAPFPKENAREPLPIGNTKSQPSTSTSRSSSLLKPSWNQKDESSEEEEEVIGGNAVMPRYSRRLLSKSLIDSTSLSEGEISPSKNVDEEKFRYLKNWTVDLSKKKNKLVLFGTLIDEKGNILQENHYSPPIAHRIQADIVEMEKGNHYRLVGLSTSRSRYFDFGFPINWQNLFKKLSRGPLPRLPPLKDSIGAQNGTNNESSVGKRDMDSISLHSRHGAPTKRRKISHEDQGQDKVRDQNNSEFSELNQPKESETIPSKPTKTVKPVRINNDKFSLE